MFNCSGWTTTHRRTHGWHWGGRNTLSAVGGDHGHPNANRGWPDTTRRRLGHPQIHQGCSHHPWSSSGVVWSPPGSTVTWVARHPHQLNFLFFIF
jgi:hypothetical protein